MGKERDLKGKFHMEGWKAYLALAVLFPVLGTLLLFLVHLLPVAPMANNVRNSLDLIRSEFTDELVVDGFRASLTGNFTDCLMLEHAVYRNEDHSRLEQALMMYRGESCDADSDELWEPGQSLVDYLQGVEMPREVTYSRYWHGYLVILKPLLAITSVNALRLFSGALHILCIGAVVMLLQKRKAVDLFTLGFLLAVSFMTYVSTFASFSLSVCFYLTMLALIVLLEKDEALYDRNRYGIFFLSIGMLTSYFDFLTYPLVTLGFPLCCYIHFHNEDLKKTIKRMFQYSVSWSVGYLWMWMSKWIITDLLYSSGTIQDAVSNLLVRTDSAQSQGRISGFMDVLKLNLGAYMNRGYILLVLIPVLILIFKKYRIDIKKGRKIISGCILFCYPFVWLFLTQNHSYQHWIFTCRILSISVFAVFAILASIERETSRNE